MHFFQNSWFLAYGSWFLLLILGTIGIIAYIHNKHKFLRRIAVYFTITLFFGISVSLNSQRSLFVSAATPTSLELNNGEREMESPSLMTNLFRLIGSMLRDKISN
ncbi:MAG: hypothetical protein IPJ31_02935 [Bacteroidetes bacterium]|nr:hypothetical protein [Bacteroidota bacterium]MBP6314813.1 hypothetical protein [Chitinophagaceae bacterium]